MDNVTIIKTIIDFIDDPYGERPSDFSDIQPITIQQAVTYLEDYRRDAKNSDDENAITAFSLATPGLFAEAYNKYISGLRFRLILDNLTDYITENNCVCEYDQFCADYQEHPVRALPVEFLDCDSIEKFPFNTSKKLSVSDLIQIGLNSSGICLNSEYVFFDESKMCLCGTNEPFKDGLLDAKGFAEFLLGDHEALEMFLNSMDDDEIMTVFGCSEDDIRNGKRLVYAITFMHNDDDPWDETIERYSTDAVANLIEEKMQNPYTLVSEFVVKEEIVW